MPINFEAVMNDPLLMGGIIVVLIAAVFYQKRNQESLMEKMNPERMDERLKKIFNDPVLNQGGAIRDWIKIRATSNTPKTLGLGVKAKEHSVIQVKIQDIVNDDQKLDTKEIAGTTYGIIEGSKKYQVIPKYWILKYLKLGYLKKKWVTVYDVPDTHIIPGESYIWFTHGTHFIEYNGVKRTTTLEAQQRIHELSFSKTHENYLETLQNIPEQYSTLNNRINGQIKMENIRSENIRDYMESKDRSGKKQGMKD